jgi:hypothetical protein
VPTLKKELWPRKMHGGKGTFLRDFFLKKYFPEPENKEKTCGE